jgi:glycosyltransferase involved in cell wall biosynthesis
MWDNGDVPTKVIEHGVTVTSDARYTGEIPRGLVAINNLASRGRRLGRDIFERLREQVPLDLVGMGSEELGGLGEIPPMEFPAFAAQYRFFFSPIRHTSLGLSICEAMTIGMPVIGLATSELATVIENGVTGYIDTEPERLVPYMQALIESPYLARRLGENAHELALRRFGIDRFVADWMETFDSVTGGAARRHALTSAEAAS